MFNPSSVIIEAFVDELVEHYVNMYGNNERHTANHLKRTKRARDYCQQ